MLRVLDISLEVVHEPSHQWSGFLIILIASRKYHHVVSDVVLPRLIGIIYFILVHFESLLLMSGVRHIPARSKFSFSWACCCRTSHIGREVTGAVVSSRGQNRWDIE